MGVIRCLLGFALVLGMVQGKSIDETIKDSLDNSPSGNMFAFSGLPGGRHLVELDILLTPEEWEAKKQEAQDQHEGDRSKRKATPHSYLRWTDKTMPYTIGSGFDANAMKNVQSAIAEWEKHTCVKFRPATDTDRNYVRILNGEGCNSHVGMTGHGQILNLGEGCKVHEIILHEIGHSLGLYHEQNRQDRDDSVWVRLEQMNPKYQFASDKTNPQDINNYGVAYDYASIMHYGEMAFGIGKEPTMITHDPSWQTRIGNAKNLSFKDIKVMNIIYNCGGHCGGKICPGEGFLDKNCQCMCPGNPTAPCGHPTMVPDPCTDNHNSCDGWANVGECQNNPGYMRGNCARACGICGPKCKDDLPDCQTMAYNGDCKRIPAFMFEKCRKSCGICYGKEHQSNCHDTNPSCAAWASTGECNANPNYMRHNCKRACASC